MTVVLSVTGPGLPVEDMGRGNDPVVGMYRVAIHLVKITHDADDARSFGRSLLAAYTRTPETEGAQLTHPGTGLTYRMAPFGVIPPDRWDALLDRADAQLVDEEPGKESS